MQQYWANFARQGFPASPGEPSWPRFHSGSQRMISLIPPAPQAETGFAAEHRCAFWATARG
jgi:carboxylesterase type B